MGVVQSKEVRAAKKRFIALMTNLYKLVAPHKASKVPSFVKRYEANGMRVLMKKLKEKYARSTGKVPLIFANMERAVNDYESALVKMSKKPNNGIFEKLGQYALSIFNQPNANKNNNGASASPSSGSAAARATAQTATQSSNSGSAKSRTQDKAATTAAIAAKKKVPIRLPNIIGRPSRLLEKKHIVEILQKLPMWCRRDDWQNLYSLSRDGVEMSTFLRKVEGKSPTLLFMKTDLGDLVGCFASHPWAPTSAFFGSGDSFLFTFRGDARGDMGGGLECFVWTGANHHFQFCQSDSIAMGGGGGLFGLYAAEDFETCSSGACLTFGNTCLTSQESFSCIDVEVFCFEIP